MSISGVQSFNSSNYGLAGSNGGSKPDSNADQQIAKLKQRDTQVRAHEAAHMAAGGQYIRGGVSFSYQTGPDGKQYAVGGEVGIDTSAVNGDPQATIQKMQIVRQAALAPADPSGQDRSVASAASAAESKAQQELASKKTGSGNGNAKQYNKYSAGKERLSSSSSKIDISA